MGLLEKRNRYIHERQQTTKRKLVLVLSAIVLLVFLFLQVYVVTVGNSMSSIRDREISIREKIYTRRRCDHDHTIT